MLLDLGDLTTSGRVSGEEILTNWLADRFIHSMGTSTLELLSLGRKRHGKYMKQYDVNFHPSLQQLDPVTQLVRVWS